MASRRSLLLCLLLNVTVWFRPLQTLTTSEHVTEARVNNTSETPSDRLERPEYHEHCVMSQPTRNDVLTLCHNRNCAAVHCVRSCNHRNLSSPRTSCSSKTCSYFTGEVFGLDPNGRAPVQFVNVSLHRLATVFSDFIKRVKGKSAMWMISNVTVQCTDVNSVMFGEEFFVDISDYLESCTAELEEDPEKFRDVSEKSNMNIHLVYFMTLSRWESYFKLPSFHSFSDNKKLDSDWNVHTFDSLQSHEFSLESNLEELLGSFLHLAENEQSVNDTETEFDLLRFATRTGRCVKFNALGCHELKIYENIQRKIADLDNQRVCVRRNSSADKTIYNLTQCHYKADDFNLDNTLLIHDFLKDAILPRDPKPATKIFSMSIIDFADLPQTSEFDSSFTRALSKVMSNLSDVFILMSDIGDTHFSKPDNSVFLRLQTFNPLLNIFIPRTNTSVHSLSVLLNQEAKTPDPRIEDQEIIEQKIGSIGFSDIRNILTTLIESGLETGEKNTENSSSHEINTMSLGDQSRVDISGDLRLAKNVFGPVESVCQGNRINFPNDTIQAAFASIVIGRVNNKLQDWARYSNKENTHRADNVVYFCNRLLGISFHNVVHVLWKDKTYILMTLQIGMKQGQGILRNLLILETEIEYTVTDSQTMNISVHFLTPRKVNIDDMFGLKNSLTDKLVHYTCRHFDGGRDGLRPMLPRSHLTYFGAPSNLRSLHHPCLFLEVTSFPDSSVIEAGNYCDDRSYNLTVGAELVNTISLTSLPALVTVQPFETRYVSTFVKAFYGASMSAYKLMPIFVVIED